MELEPNGEVFCIHPPSIHSSILSTHHPSIHLSIHPLWVNWWLWVQTHWFCWCPKFELWTLCGSQKIIILLSACTNLHTWERIIEVKKICWKAQKFENLRIIPESKKARGGGGGGGGERRWSSFSCIYVGCGPEALANCRVSLDKQAAHSIMTLLFMAGFMAGWNFKPKTSLLTGWSSLHLFIKFMMHFYER